MELHDDLNQQVALLGIRLTALKRSLAERSNDERVVAIIESGLAQLANSIHALSHELHPALLEQTGIGPVLKKHCEELQAVTGIEVGVMLGEIPDIPKDLALCLYRVTQEALRNAVKHSGAKEVWVSLLWRDGQIELRVEDSGRGLAAQHVAGTGIGMVSMKDRVRVVGGTVRFENRVGGGTVMSVAIPHVAVSLPESSGPRPIEHRRGAYAEA